MSICSRLVSGSAALRGVNGKISMIQKGQVSIERICRYVVRLTFLEIFFPQNEKIAQRGQRLRDAAIQYIFSHKELKRPALAQLEHFEPKCYRASATRFSIYSPGAAQMAIGKIRDSNSSPNTRSRICLL